MKYWIKRRLTLALSGILACLGAGLFALSYSGCVGNTARTELAVAPCNCAAISVKFGPFVPGDAFIFGSQANADCFAWSEFVALNWPSASGAGFGDPGDKGPVQWETYMPSDVLYNKDGTAPPRWGSTLIPRAFAGRMSLLGLPQTTKILHFSSKFEDVPVGSMRFATGQAFPMDEPSWLGAQNGTNVWYEILVNKDIYDYVVRTHFYDARAQVDSAHIGVPVNFPAGMWDPDNKGVTGAIELKAAWMEVKDPGNAKWNRFKLSQAEVQDANTGQMRTVTVALVGLHILHKTAQQPSWVWATFEQVDNVPGSPGTNGDYSFYNDHCALTMVNVHPGCAADGKTGRVGVDCPPNVHPPYYLCAGGPGPFPIQLTRVTDLDATVKQYNQLMQGAIRDRNSKSVWQYYELVNVLWSNGAQPISKDTTSAPFQLSTALMQPPVGNPVANTTMESYIQKTVCTDCHTSARIAPIPGDTMKTFSDFSFIIGTAGASRRY